MLPSVSFETEIFDQGSSGSGEFVAHTHTQCVEQALPCWLLEGQEHLADEIRGRVPTL